MEKTKVAIYTRVSSEEQVKGYSLESQEEKLVAFCKIQDYELGKEHIFREEGESGAKKNRTQLDRLMLSARGREFNLVLVNKLDRFSRNLKNLLELVGELEEYGIGFKSITETFDTSTPMGKYMLQNMGSIAELEREMIRERMVSGQIKNKQAGNWVSGTPPYGYNYNKETKKLEINQEEARIVKKLYKWVVDERLSLIKIQQRLTDLNVPTKFDNIGRKKKTNGTSYWNKRTIGRIITNEVYTGHFTFFKYKYLGKTKGENNLRPKEDWVDIATPKIIKLSFFNLAQEQLRKNKKHSRGNGKHIYLFSRLIKCGVCGYAYGSMYETKGYGLRDRKRYFCFGSRADIRQITCKNKSVSESVIAIPIWEKLVSALINPKLAFEQLIKIQKDKNGELDSKEQINEIDILLNKAKNKEKRLLDLYLDGGLEKNIYEAKLLEIKENLERLNREKAKYENLIISSEEEGLRINSLRALYEKFKNNLSTADYEQKREIIRMLVEKIVIKGKNIDIRCNIPYKYSFVGQNIHCLPHEKKEFSIVLQTKLLSLKELAQEDKRILNIKKMKQYC